MKASWNKYPDGRARWLPAISIVLAGWGLLFHFFPDLSEKTPLHRPFSPVFRYHHDEKSGHGGVAGELNAVWSPALIALPNGLAYKALGNNHISMLTPPLEAFHEPPLLLDRPPARRTERIRDAASSEKQAGTERVALKRFTASAVDGERSKQEHGVQTALSGKLKHASIDWPPFDLGEWTQKDSSWSATLYVHFDAEGQPINVFVETPARDQALNEQLARTAYQSRLSSPKGPVEGRITLWLH